MKKVLLLALLFVGISASAQNSTKINKEVTLQDASKGLVIRVDDSTTGKQAAVFIYDKEVLQVMLASQGSGSVRLGTSAVSFVTKDNYTIIAVATSGSSATGIMKGIQALTFVTTLQQYAHNN